MTVHHAVSAGHEKQLGWKKYVPVEGFGVGEGTAGALSGRGWRELLVGGMEEGVDAVRWWWGQRPPGRSHAGKVGHPDVAAETKHIRDSRTVRQRRADHPRLLYCQATQHRPFGTLGPRAVQQIESLPRRWHGVTSIEDVPQMFCRSPDVRKSL